MISTFELVLEQSFFHAVSYLLYIYTPSINFATRMFVFFQMIIHQFKVRFNDLDEAHIDVILLQS